LVLNIKVLLSKIEGAKVEFYLNQSDKKLTTKQITVVFENSNWKIYKFL